MCSKQQEEWAETQVISDLPRDIADVSCNPVLSHPVKCARAGSWYLLMRDTAQMLSLLEKCAYTQDAVKFNATTNVLEVGKWYVEILHDVRAFPDLQDCSGHFQLIFFPLHICLRTRRKLLELLLKRNKYNEEPFHKGAG